MSEPDLGDVYRPPQAPLPRAAPRPWLAGFALATLPSLLYFVVARWLPGWLTLFLWIVVVVLTFYGVGVFVWSTKEKPTWGRAVLAVVVTGAWMQVVSYLVALMFLVFGAS